MLCVPLVEIIFNPKTYESQAGIIITYCNELVTAAMNSEMGPLSPGEIEIACVRSFVPMNVMAIIKITAKDYADRRANFEHRVKCLRQAFDYCCVSTFSAEKGCGHFLLYVELTDAEFATNRPDDFYKQARPDMSMNAAIRRLEFSPKDNYNL